MNDVSEPGWKMPEHPCAVCGQPTIFYRCDACFYGPRGPLPSAKKWRTEERRPLTRRLPPNRWSQQPPAPAPGQQPTPAPEQGPGQPSREFLVAAREAYVEWKCGELRQRVERGRLGGADDGDEFAATLRAWAASPTEIPPLAAGGWWGMCLWCARELTERSAPDNAEDSGASYWPLSLARIRPCARHSAALVRWTRWQRREEAGRALARLFTRHFGFGPDEQTRETGGAA